MVKMPAVSHVPRKDTGAGRDHEFKKTTLKDSNPMQGGDGTTPRTPLSEDLREKGNLKEWETAHLQEVDEVHVGSLEPIKKLEAKVYENNDGTTQAKWKRLPRMVVGTSSTSADLAGSQHPMDMASNLNELPSKKMWAIWNHRNQVHVKEAACPLDQILNLSKERKAEFQGTRPPTQKRVHRNHVGWRPQIVDEVKINYDGAIFSREGRVGLGVVCCNSDAVITSLSEQISLPATITQVEALAVRRAAVFAVDLGITSTILEGDSNIVYKDLSSIEPSLALHGHIIHDVK
nr:hypothetical protein CFP56_53457 [Quercus suber]